MLSLLLEVKLLVRSSYSQAWKGKQSFISEFFVFACIPGTYFQPSAAPQLQQTSGSVTVHFVRKTITPSPEISVEEYSHQKLTACTVPRQTETSKKQSIRLKLFKQLWISKSLVDCSQDQANEMGRVSTDEAKVMIAGHPTSHDYSLSQDLGELNVRDGTQTATAPSKPITKPGDEATAVSPLVDMNRFVNMLRGKRKTLVRSLTINTTYNEPAESEPELAVGRESRCMFLLCCRITALFLIFPSPMEDETTR